MKSTLPLITSAPHDSDHIPRQFAHRLNLSNWHIWEMSDKYSADVIFNKNAILNFRSRLHRALWDLNREKSSCFPVNDFRWNRIWKYWMWLSLAQKASLVFQHYDSSDLIINNSINKQARYYWFRKLLFADGHCTWDYNTETWNRDRNMWDSGKPMPPFIIINHWLPDTAKVDSERWYPITCPPELMIELKFLIEREFEHPVQINTLYPKWFKYNWWYLSRKIWDENYPSDVERWSFQIEYNRAMIMDQKTRIPYKSRITDMNQKFNFILNDLCKNTVSQY